MIKNVANDKDVSGNTGSSFANNFIRFYVLTLIVKSDKPQTIEKLLLLGSSQNNVAF